MLAQGCEAGALLLQGSACNRHCQGSPPPPHVSKETGTVKAVCWQLCRTGQHAQAGACPQHTHCPGTHSACCKDRLGGRHAGGHAGSRPTHQDTHLLRACRCAPCATRAPQRAAGENSCSRLSSSSSWSMLLCLLSPAEYPPHPWSPAPTPPSEGRGWLW